MITSLPRLSDQEYEYFRNKVLELCGIYLSESKKELIQTRLQTRMDELGLKDYRSYQHYLSTIQNTDPEWQMLINLMTTNKTDFFREPLQFRYLKEEFLPEWEKRYPNTTLRVWCAASSTGEEPYSL